MFDSKYFQREMNENNERFMNARGIDFGVNNFRGQSFLNETGDFGGDINQSQPYVFSIENTTTTAITDATLLNSYGYAAVSGASITYDISGTTYAEFLKQTEDQPFTVGLTRLSSTSTSQVQQSIQISTKDANGSRAVKSFIPQYDRYQQITTIIDVPYKYIVNGYTSLIISSLLASTKLTITLFPFNKLNQINVLNNQNVQRNYSDPNINPALGR